MPVGVGCSFYPYQFDLSGAPFLHRIVGILRIQEGHDLIGIAMIQAGWYAGFPIVDIIILYGRQKRFIGTVIDALFKTVR